MQFGPIEIDFDASVLRPRPWTLAQAEWAADLADGPMLEIGCGAGHIGLAAAVLSGHPLVQVDVSPAACRWAAHNATRAGVAERVTQRCGTPEEVLTADDRFRLVLADPPYLPSADIGRFPEDPSSAVDGGADGLGLARSFVLAGAAHLDPGGDVVLQLWGQHQVGQFTNWLSGQADVDLVVVETRTYGEDRALVRLVLDV